MISNRLSGLMKVSILTGLSATCGMAGSIAYNVTAIQTPAGMTGITLSGINDAGQIAGAGTLSGALDVFIATTSGDTLIPLPTGSTNLTIGDINSTGQVSGSYAPSGAIKAFEADTTNGITTFSASSQYFGYSINDSGDVSGHISTGPAIFSQSGNTTFTDPSGYAGGY
ncbi:MAG: hypothetical protein KGN84_04505, partial [Acidobacteriota bacterium]|nr:hypothetical protein [Acidobacteriota bacterium]